MLTVPSRTCQVYNYYYTMHCYVLCPYSKLLHDLLYINSFLLSGLLEYPVPETNLIIINHFSIIAG